MSVFVAAGAVLGLGGVACSMDAVGTLSGASQLEASRGNVGAVVPGTSSVAVGKQVQLSAVDANGNPVDARWSSSNASVATVSNSGLVTGVKSGDVVITAQTHKQSAKAKVSVLAASDTASGTASDTASVASVAVSPGTATLAATGDTVQLKATAKDTSGAVITGVSVTWSSNDPGVATVSTKGLVTAVAAGSAKIVATVEGTTGSASVTISTSTDGGTVASDTTRPYIDSSPWNTRIPLNAAADPASTAMVATIAASSNGLLRSDPTQYTFPVYYADASTPRRTLTCSGYAWTIRPDGSRVSQSGATFDNVPIPADATPSSGSDGQIIVVDRETGDEWDVWRFVAPGGCENATRYVSGMDNDAVEPNYRSRGAGVPYLAGVIRPSEIARGRIDHALAFAYSKTRSERCVWPASKTDGSTTDTNAIPEGARLQLDPSLDVNQIQGLSSVGRIIARALQEYGAYLIDTSGSNKIYAEDNLTANWGTTLTASTVAAIPVDRLRVLRLPDAYRASSYNPTHGACVQ